MTAFEVYDAEFRRLLESVKIDEFIQKPFSFKDLARMIRKHLEIHRGQNLVYEQLR